MTTEILIEKVREELCTLDVPAGQAIATAMKILQSEGEVPLPHAL